MPTPAVFAPAPPKTGTAGISTPGGKIALTLALVAFMVGSVAVSRLVVKR